MADANRSINVGVDTGDAVQGIDALRKGAEALYTETQKKAEGYSKSLQEQGKRVQELLSIERDRLKQVIEGGRLEIQIESEKKIASLDPRRLDFENKKNAILEEQKKKLEEITKEYKEQAFVIDEASLKGREQYDGSGSGKKGGGGGRFGGAALGMGAAMAGGAGAAAIIAGIPMVGGILSAWFNIAKEQEAAQNQLRSTTGSEISAGSGARFGMSTTELAKMQRQIAITRGVGGDTLANDVKNQMISEKAFGLGEGQLTGLSAFERMGGSSPMELMQDFLARASRSELWDIELDGNGKIKGFADLGNLMGDMNSLMEQESQVSENFSGERSAQLLEQFGGLGGGFEDSRRMGRMMNLHQAIKSGGGNEFMEAEIMTALLGEDSSQSLHQVRQRRKQGIFGEGNLSAVLERGQEITGGNQEMMEAFLDVFTGGSFTPEALSTLAASDPERFRGKKGEDLKAEMKKAGVDTTGMESRSDAALGGLEVFDTAMKDSAGIIGRNITESLETPLKEFSLGMIEFAKDPIKGMEDLWSKGVDNMVKVWKEKLTDPDVIKKVVKQELPMTYAAASAINKVAVKGTSPHQVENSRYVFTGGGAK